MKAGPLFMSLLFTISELSIFGWCFSGFSVITLSLMQQNKSQRIFSSTSTKKVGPLQRVWVSIFWSEWQNGLLQGKCKHTEDNEGRSTERQLIWDLRHHKSLGRVWYHFQVLSGTGNIKDGWQYECLNMVQKILRTSLYKIGDDYLHRPKHSHCCRW